MLEVSQNILNKIYYMHVYPYIHTKTYIHTRICIHKHIYTHTQIYIHTKHIHTYTDIIHTNIYHVKHSINFIIEKKRRKKKRN